MKLKFIAVIAAITLSASSGVSVAAAAVGPPTPTTTVTSDAGGSAIPDGAVAKAGPAVAAAAAALADAPTDLAGTDVTDTSITLNWMAPANIGATSAQYAVASTSDNGATWAYAYTPVGTPPAPTFTLTGLTPGTPYVFGVVAINSDGWGAWSANAAVSTTGGVAVTLPEAPTELAGTDVTATSITLNWVAPANIGATSARYAVARTSDNGATWAYEYTPLGTPPATTFTLTGLTPGTPYLFGVVAINSAGWGAWSANAAVSTTAPGDGTAPGDVTGLWADPNSSTDDSVGLRWINPTADFTGVVIRRLEGNIAPTLETGTLVRDLIDEVPYIIDIGMMAWVPAEPGIPAHWVTVAGTRPTPGTTYTYTVFAHDAANNYAPGVSVTYTTAGGVHVGEPVTALTGTTVSDTEIELAWTNPPDVDFTGVMIRRLEGTTAPAYDTGTLVINNLPAPATSFLDTGLTMGTVYSYAIFASDSGGNHSVAANVTVSEAPTAVLLVSSDGEFFSFDASTSTAVAPKTVVSAILDYGDGTEDVLTGDEGTGWSGAHFYEAGGSYVVTLTVTDSAGVSASTTESVTVSLGAAIMVDGSTTASAQVGTPVVFTLTPTTVPAITSWGVWDSAGDSYEGGLGTPPTSVAHTFTAPGEYTVNFGFENAAGQTVQSSMVVTVFE